MPILPADPTRTAAQVVPALASVFSIVFGRTALLFGAELELLKSPLHIYHGNWWSWESSVPNAALHAFAGSARAGASPKPWYGTVLVLKLDDVATPRYADFEPSDIAHVRAYFTMYK